jgi:stage IV sporulation protein FB
MGWEERPYYRDRGYSSNPLTALLSGSVPLFTAFGIRVRAHNALIVFIACELLLDWTKGYDLSNKLVSMGMLGGVILLHEFGHCFAARFVGGSASDILLWPLGGLAFPETPHRPGARFWMVAGGPLVNVAICAVAAAGVYLLADHTIVQLNPFQSLLPAEAIGWHSAAFYLWWLFIVSYLLLLLNLLPIFPLDGGQMLQSVLWKITDYHRSMLISCVVGMVGAAMVAVIGLVRWEPVLILLAVWAFYTCYRERMVLQEAGPGEPWQEELGDFSSSLYREPATGRRKVSKKVLRLARRRARQEVAERQRLDAILAKVSTQGLASLTWRERRVLRNATEQRRKREEEMRELLGE